MMMMNIFVHVCTCAYIYICMYTYVCIHIYLYTVRFREIGTGISEPSKRVPIFVGLFWRLFCNKFTKETYKKFKISRWFLFSRFLFQVRGIVLYVCVYICTYIYIYIHIYIYVYIYVCVCVCIYIYIYIHIHVCIYVYM